VVFETCLPFRSFNACRAVGLLILDPPFIGRTARQVYSMADASGMPLEGGQ